MEIPGATLHAANRQKKLTNSGARPVIPPPERVSARNANKRVNYAHHTLHGINSSNPTLPIFRVVKSQKIAEQAKYATEVTKPTGKPSTATAEPRSKSQHKSQEAGRASALATESPGQGGGANQSGHTTPAKSISGPRESANAQNTEDPIPQLRQNSSVADGPLTIKAIDHLEQAGEYDDGVRRNQGDAEGETRDRSEQAAFTTDGLSESELATRSSRPTSSLLQGNSELSASNRIEQQPSEPISPGMDPDVIVLRTEVQAQPVMAGDNGDPATLSANVQTLNSDQAATRSRPRRAVKPVKRFQGLIETPKQDEGEDDNIVVAPRSRTLISGSSASKSNSIDFEAQASKATRGRGRKRKASVSPDSTTGVAKRSKKLMTPSEPASSVVTLRISPSKLGNTGSESLPQRNKATAAREPAQSLQTLESTNEATSRLDQPDTALLQLSRKLMERQPIDKKQGPRGHPQVWAESRQALCETVPYFKSPQSGSYQNNGHVYAFLYDGVGHCREYMDTDVIIARAGGSMETDASGNLVQAKDHSFGEAQVQAVLNDIEHQNPLIVICGDKHSGALCKMPHKYCVLGWYKPVAVWAEKTLGKKQKSFTTIKYRLERLGSKEDVWYAPTEESVTDEDRILAGELAQKTCHVCQTSFPQVYLTGWMCLDSSCANFWTLSSGEDAPHGILPYNPAFLLHRTPWQSEEAPYSVRPPLPAIGKILGDNLTNINTRGIVCPHCGRCNQRRLWRGWTCENTHCTFSAFPTHIPLQPTILHQPWDSIGDGPTLSRNKYARDHGVTVAVSHHAVGFKVFTYTFEGLRGKLIHAVSNAKINGAPGGPDEMFAAMQRQEDAAMELHLERRPFVGTGGKGGVSVGVEEGKMEERRSGGKRAKMRVDAGTGGDEDQDALVRSMLENSSQALFGPVQPDSQQGEDSSDPTPKPTAQPPPTAGDLMTAFSVNYGLPYKFIASVDSHPFTTAPWPVRASRADLNWASQNLCSPCSSPSPPTPPSRPNNPHQTFNEQLIFAYMQAQKVEYHDDGECGLGPRIASLSLGGRAQMLLRMKHKHHLGCSKTGILTADKPVLPRAVHGGREQYERRLAAWEEGQALLAQGDRRVYERRRKEIPVELGLSGKGSKRAADLVTLTLNHGDVVIMDGDEVQRYLEHKVVAEGCLRFALTCRTVLPEHLQAEERPAYGVEEDEVGMSSLRRLDAAAGGGGGGEAETRLIEGQ